MEYFCHSTYNKRRSRKGWGLKSPVLGQGRHPAPPGESCGVLQKGQTEAGCHPAELMVSHILYSPISRLRKKKFLKVVSEDQTIVSSAMPRLSRQTWVPVQGHWCWRCFECRFYVVGCLCTMLITSVKAPTGSRESKAASFPRRDECCSLWYSHYGLAKEHLYQHTPFFCDKTHNICRRGGVKI